MNIQHKIMFLFLMFWLHIVDDFYLQGILAKMKQKSWWEANAPDSMYKHDYKAALIIHAFSWTCLIMLPAIILYLAGQTNPNFFVVAAFIVFNTGIHATIDNLKANRKKINLVEDQLIHMIQIIISWIVCISYV